jgi:glycosyltransferase involved in cell wall biosynthesis
MEALMRGVPVVSGTWSAARECIEDGRTGILYDSPTVAALTAALEAARSLPPFDPAELSLEIDEQSHLDKLLTLYDGMLERRTAAAKPA